jgi:hypothetical protein
MGDLDDQLRRLAEQRAARTPVTTSADVATAEPQRPNRFPVLLAAAATFAVLTGLAIWLAGQNDENGTDVAGTTTTGPPPVSTTAPPPVPITPEKDTGPTPTMTVSATDYGVRLEIPAGWAEIEQGRTWGDDGGFVAVDVAPGATVAEASDRAIADSDSFFGDAPTITETTVGGRPARLIVGNAATVGSDFGDFLMSGVVIELATPITVHDESWDVLAIVGDLPHLTGILESLEWIDPTTPAPVRAEIDAIDPTVAYDLVVGTTAGIELRRTFTDDVDVLSGAPTELAFLVDGWLISQDEPRGPVRVGTGPFPDGLDVGEGDLRLFDAAIVDGRASALVTRRTGTTPDDSRERLLMVDVVAGSVADLGVVGGWESGLADARFADGAIALLRSTEGFTRVSALDYSGTELWSTPEDFEGPQNIAVASDTVWIVDPGWNADDTAPQISETRYELRNGDIIDETTRVLTPVDGVALDEVYCRRLMMWAGAICSQTIGSPVQLDLFTQTIAPVQGPLSGGITTAVDVAVSTTFPPPTPREVLD